MRQVYIKPKYIVAVLAVACLYIWALDLYLESGFAEEQGTGTVPMVAAVDAYIAKSLGLPYSVPTGGGLEKSSELIALLSVYQGKPLALDTRTQTTGCIVNGPLPDRECTPGAVFDVSTTTMCTSGYSRSVRNVSVKTKRQMYTAYGLEYPQPTGTYEMDHLIPLELGGNNDVANLFPEAAAPPPGFREKDLVENYLHDEVCAGVIDLAAAQEQIARDWVAVYNTLTPSTITALKRQIASYGR